MRIVLLSDGTGNAASKVWRTNVWRIFESLDLSTSDQIALYNDGVGTSSFKPLAILGGAFGWGLKRNVIDIYKFLCRNYSVSPKPDEVYMFGFSRGAFTIRVLMGLALSEGLVPNDSESDLDALAIAAYRAYRAKHFHTWWRIEAPFRFLRDIVVRYVYPRTKYDPAKNRPLKNIRFLGLWDTVAAYGLPVDEMTRGVSRFLFPMELPNHRLNFDVVKRACHALSLDDERTTFHPELWDERNAPAPIPAGNEVFTKDETISQVWFAGVHSNVGGGYPDDSLALIPMYWIMREAEACGLQFKTAANADPDTIVHTRSSRDKDGRLYDSRQGLGGYYRYGPRKLADLCQPRLSWSKRDDVWIATPKIHESVLKRIEIGAHSYAPIGLPASYDVVLDSGQIVPLGTSTWEDSTQAADRAQHQEVIWNLVWWKRLVYFLTVGASLFLALYPLILRFAPEDELDSRLRPVSDLIRIAGAFIPNTFSLWIEGYARSPGLFLLACFAVGAFIFLGLSIGASISDRMRVLWRSKGGSGPLSPPGFVYLLRSSKPYHSFLRTIKFRIAPVFFAALFFYLGLVVVSHFAFNFIDASGLTCPAESTNAKKLDRGQETTVPLIPIDPPKEIPANSLCFPTGILIEKDARYQFTVKANSRWERESLQLDTLTEKSPASVRGYTLGNVRGVGDILLTLFATPLRRDWLRPWHVPIVRIGRLGTEESFMDADPKEPDQAAHSENDRATRSGELYFYINDGVVAFPYAFDLFYRYNIGTATLTVKRTK